MIFINNSKMKLSSISTGFVLTLFLSCHFFSRLFNFNKVCLSFSKAMVFLIALSISGQNNVQYIRQGLISEIGISSTRFNKLKILTNYFFVTDFLHSSHLSDFIESGLQSNAMCTFLLDLD